MAGSGAQIKGLLARIDDVVLHQRYRIVAGPEHVPVQGKLHSEILDRARTYHAELLVHLSVICANS
jgi:hypothetical protein